MLSVFVRNNSTRTLLNAGKLTKSTLIGERIQPIKTRKRTKSRPTHMMDRIWENLDVTSPSGWSSTEQQFTLLSYNILAQDLLIEHLYLYLGIEPPYLKWDHRLNCLTTEIADIAPDILCLQEMQYSHIKNLVRHIRGQRKLEYVFKKKTGHRTDGCAIIYDKQKFRLLEEHSVEYHTPGDMTLNRENIALLAKFNLRANPDKKVIVATTHLLYNPRRHDVRAAQVNKLLEALQAFSIDTTTNGQQALLPIVVTGDFNAEPDSPPYSLLTAPYRRTMPEDAAMSNSSPKKYLKTPASGSDAGELELLSLNFGRKCASTLQNSWILVDYILHSVGQNREHIKVWSVYRLPTIQECAALGQMPNKFLGSDHYSLAITFSI